MIFLLSIVSICSSLYFLSALYKIRRHFCLLGRFVFTLDEVVYLLLALVECVFAVLSREKSGAVYYGFFESIAFSIIVVPWRLISRFQISLADVVMLSLVVFRFCWRMIVVFRCSIKEKADMLLVILFVFATFLPLVLLGFLF